MCKLTTAQRAGALAITGGFCTSPTNVLEAHTALIPMNHKIDKIRSTKTIRLASLPETHPLCKQFTTTYRRNIKRHRSSLHKLASTLSSDLDKIETVPVVILNPALRRSNPLKTSIAGDKEASKREDANAWEEIKVKRSTRMVRYTTGRWKRQQCCIGRASSARPYASSWVRQKITSSLGAWGGTSMGQCSMVSLIRGRLPDTITKPEI